jgi:hypothetical protein
VHGLDLVGVAVAQPHCVARQWNVKIHQVQIEETDQPIVKRPLISAL